jgi:uncharacterized Zn ribbon protein
MDIILNALAELPYKMSGALIEECMKQWTQQEAAAEAAKNKQADDAALGDK